MYGRYKLSFFVYTKSNRIEIESNTLYSRGVDEKTLNSDKEYDLKFRQGYYESAELIYDICHERRPFPIYFYENKLDVENKLKQSLK
jgi:hypothetical protein